MLLVALIVTGAFLLSGGTVKENVLTGKKVSFEDDTSSYKTSVSDSNGNTVLYNAETAFVAIKKSSDNKVLLPMGKVASKDNNSSLLNITVRDRKGNSYIMNSNSNSVEFGTFQITEEKNLLRIVFSFFKDKESAKDGFKLNGFAVQIPVVFTTETVYGIGADALNDEAVDKIFKAKGRPQDNPLIVHIAEFDELYDLVEEVPENAKLLAEQFWPGPLTMILYKKKILSDKFSSAPTNEEDRKL